MNSAASVDDASTMMRAIAQASPDALITIIAMGALSSSALQQKIFMAMRAMKCLGSPSQIS